MDEDYDHYLRRQETKSKKESYSPKVQQYYVTRTQVHNMRWHFVCVLCSSMAEGNMPGTEN